MFLDLVDRLWPCSAAARAQAVAYAVLVVCVAALYVAQTVREARRQRAYRDALSRGDWPAVNRMMGLER